MREIFINFKIGRPALELALLGGKLELARPDTRGRCPLCLEEVISKTGEINEWHWAHHPDSLCQGMTAKESIWHRGWKAACRPGTTEWPRKNKAGVKRRADCWYGKSVWEFRASPLPVDEIQDRAKFWRDFGGIMHWILKADDKNFVIEYNPKYRSHSIYRSDSWPTLPIYLNTGITYVDLGEDGVLNAERSNERGTWAAGSLLTRDSMEAWVRGEQSEDDQRADPDGLLHPSGDRQSEEVRIAPNKMAEPSPANPDICRHCRRPIEDAPGDWQKEDQMIWHTETGMFRCNSL